MLNNSGVKQIKDSDCETNRNEWNMKTVQTRKQFFQDSYVFIFSPGSVRVSGKFYCSGLLCATKPIGSKRLLTVTLGHVSVLSLAATFKPAINGPLAYHRN